MSKRAMCVVMALALGGCSEARVVDVGSDAQPADAPRAPDDVAVDAAAPIDAATTGDVAAPTDRPAGAGRVVINEIRGRGDNWVELHNVGDGAYDLSGFRVADSDADGGAPRTDEALRFPAGTTLGAGEYLFLLGNVADAGVGRTSACADAGVATCFQMHWSISNSRGETVWLLDPGGATIASQHYPMDAVPSGQTYGRLPNGTGPFTATRPTPGAANQAP